MCRPRCCSEAKLALSSSRQTVRLLRAERALMAHIFKMAFETTTWRTTKWPILCASCLCSGTRVEFINSENVSGEWTRWQSKLSTSQPALSITKHCPGLTSLYSHLRPSRRTSNSKMHPMHGWGSGKCFTSPGFSGVTDSALSKCFRNSTGQYKETATDARSLLTTRIVESSTTKLSPSLLLICTPPSRHMKLTAAPWHTEALPTAFSTWPEVP
mmetsp:Transcript_2747/g.10814  ORF Transcript_2747/g.10814 Transcript_2747/m.10814 type:complete len:214 (-) Transcript_2747:4094-4735(-)